MAHNVRNEEEANGVKRSDAHLTKRYKKGKKNIKIAQIIPPLSHSFLNTQRGPNIAQHLQHSHTKTYRNNQTHTKNYKNIILPRTDVAGRQPLVPFLVLVVLPPPFQMHLRTSAAAVALYISCHCFFSGWWLQPVP